VRRLEPVQTPVFEKISENFIFRVPPPGEPVLRRMEAPDGPHLFRRSA
jgi:hypothetical protein